MIEEFENESDMQKREAVFGLKMSKEEIKALKERAHRLGMSAGAYLRFLFHREIQGRKQENFSLTKE
jgi:predicted DNA binding CopG/RHH family protein